MAVGVIGGAGYIGTTDATALKIVTDSSERMRITSGGDVGIGTSSPTVPLDVRSSGAGIARITSTGSGSSILYFSDINSTGGFAQSIGSVGDDLRALTGSTERLRIDSSGNVGIGTSSPSSNLHVESSGVANAQLTSTGNNANLLVQAADGYVSRLWFGDNSAYNVGSIQYLHTGDAMTFTVNASERLRIDSSGNILIGTSATGASILRIVGLPTSSAGLSSGDVWNDGGTLKIV
jgi:hypothetical protein